MPSKGKSSLRALKAWTNSHKTKPCMDCGGTFDPVCMDFDHREDQAERKPPAAHGGD